MPRSHYTSRSHAVKNILQSKEETDDTLTEKTEQVTSDMTQGLRTFKHRFVALQCVVTDHCVASVQTREPIVFSYLHKARNEHK